MIGANNKSAILVLTDRKSRFNKFSKLKDKKSDKVAAATIKSLKGLPAASLNNDRGKEFADHKTVTKKLGLKSTFVTHTPLVKEEVMKIELDYY